MPLTSDFELDASKFDPKNVDETSRKFNAGLSQITGSTPNWWEIGAARAREMRKNGEGALPKPLVIESGEDVEIPSREAGRSIPCRVFRPEGTAAKAVYYHIHGGGWVLMDHKTQDRMLKRVADRCGVVMVSVGYRLAPEHPFPQPNEDCYDVGEYLVDHAQRDFGVPLAFIGGESAGGHLSATTTLHLLKERPDFRFKGVVLSFGAFNLVSPFPQTTNMRNSKPPVLTEEIYYKFRDAFLPGMTEEQRRDPNVSPFYADFSNLQLPSALFLCGTNDILMDDSVFMSVKWKISGAESILKIYPGAIHGFIGFPVDDERVPKTTQQALDDAEEYIKGRL